jgi:1,4-alpha-glucan branching enzyme
VVKADGGATILVRIAAGLVALLTIISCAGYLEKSVESPVIAEEQVIFRYASPSARTVQVAGDWNNWGRGDAEQGEVLVGLMHRDDRGLWELAEPLSSGRYRYYFIINESRRVPDPANPRITEDPWGGKASLLIVP